MVRYCRREAAPLSHAASDNSVSGSKPSPMPFGNDFDGVVDHFDGGLVVDRVRRPPETGRPFFCGRHGVLWQELVVNVREDREVDNAQCAVVTGGWLPPDEGLP